MTPFLTPDRDDDPLGVYCVEPISTYLQNRFDSVSPLDQDNEEEELDAIHAENRKIARLIAAAPTMLEALELVQRAWVGDGVDMASAVDACLLAIAKAEGRDYL